MYDFKIRVSHEITTKNVAEKFRTLFTRTLASTALLLFLTSCVNDPDYVRPGPMGPGNVRSTQSKENVNPRPGVGVHNGASGGALTDKRIAVLRSAQSLLGIAPNSKVTIRGKTFTLDCIGTISAAWWGAGYDIQKDFHLYSGNGVLRLYDNLKDKKAIHTSKRPTPGDIVFWSNTYDRNNNGIMYDDGLTHAGLVMQVDDDGTVHYLHLSTTRGVAIAYFNLHHPKTAFSPSGKVWNSPMYLSSHYNNKVNPPHWLSGDLWTAFGNADKI